MVLDDNVLPLCAEMFELLSQIPNFTGDEAALCLSPLLAYQDPPEARNMPTELPAYSKRPEYLPPNHCRLCLQVCEMPTPPLQSVAEDRDVHPAVMAHVREHHGLKDADAYRRAIFGRSAQESLRAVTAQVQRIAVHRYMARLCDANYSMSFCACCACIEKKKDLTMCEFPARSSPQKPDWVIFNDSRWNTTCKVDAAGNHITFGEAWFDQVKDVLHVSSYESTYLEIPQRVQAAEKWNSAPSEGDSEEVKRLWLERVKQWARNMRKDLRDDGVPEPGSSLAATDDSRERWMLYIPDYSPGEPLVEEAPAIVCQLCHDCRNALGREKPLMPWKARARGMWRGPAVPALENLTWAELAVIQLARLHIQVVQVVEEALSVSLWAHPG